MPTLGKTDRDTWLPLSSAYAWNLTMGKREDEGSALRLIQSAGR